MNIWEGEKKRKRAGSFMPLLMRSLILLDQGPTLMISFYLNYLFKGRSYKYSHIMSYWDLGLQQCEF